MPLDDRREWYRYHHLFADVLRAHLLAEQPDLVPLLHQRASLWYERHDLTEEAVRHALAARDFDRAAYLMELAAPAIRRHRQEAVLLGWLQELPDAAVRRSPVLSVFYGYMLMVSGDLAGFEARLDDAERALAAVPDGETPRGLTPRSSRRCRRPSPSTGPRSPRHEAMWQARRNMPGAPSISPAPTIISRGAVRSGSWGSPRGRRGT